MEAAARTGVGWRWGRWTGRETQPESVQRERETEAAASPLPDVPSTGCTPSPLLHPALPCSARHEGSCKTQLPPTRPRPSHPQLCLYKAVVFQALPPPAFPGPLRVSKTLSLSPLPISPQLPAFPRRQGPAVPSAPATNTLITPQWASLFADVRAAPEQRLRLFVLFGCLTLRTQAVASHSLRAPVQPSQPGSGNGCEIDRSSIPDHSTRPSCGLSHQQGEQEAADQ